MIHLGCCAFAFGYLTLPGALRQIRDMGIGYVDLGCMDPGEQINPDAIAARPAMLARDVRSDLDAVGLIPSELFIRDVWNGSRGVMVNDPDAAARAAMIERTKAYCEFAAEVGCTSVLTLPGVPQKGLSAEDAWALSVDSLTQMVAIAQDADVALHVEAHVGSIVQDPADALVLVQQVEGLGLTLDLAHFVGLGFDQDAALPLYDYVGHMHGKPACPGWPESMFIDNTIDFAAAFAALEARTWNGVVAVETIGHLGEDGLPVYKPLQWGHGRPDVAPGVACRPVVQAALMAHHLETCLPN